MGNVGFFVIVSFILYLVYFPFLFFKYFLQAKTLSDQNN